MRNVTKLCSGELATKRALLALLIVMAGGLGACDAVLGLGEWSDRVPGTGAAAGPDAAPGEDGTDGGTQTGTDSGTDSAVNPGRVGPGGLIDFGPAPEGGPVLSTLTCPVLAMPAMAGTVFVDAKATGAEAGTKAAPFRTITKAFASAPQNGIVWVAAGTYKETLVIPDKGILLLGGFAPGFGARKDACATILEPATAAGTVLSASGVKSFAVEGLTVQKGARGMAAAAGDNAVAGSFTIARCVFSENGKITEVGGGATFDGVSARIFGSVFRENRGHKGAALATLANDQLTIDQNLFEKNNGYWDHGGGLYLSPKNAKISRNTFRGNATGLSFLAEGGGGWGGALLVYGSPAFKAKADLSFNVFTDNVAYNGAALFVDDGATVTMSHDLVYRNRAYAVGDYLRGVAFYVDGTGLGPAGGSTLTAEYLTVANNVYDSAGQLGTPTVGGVVYVEVDSKATFTNSIFWNNGANAFYVEPGNVITVSNSIAPTTCTSSDAQGFIPANTTICKMGGGIVLPAAVHFADEAAGDYHEKSTAGRFSKGMWVLDAVTSPAVDMGDPLAAFATEPAPNGGRSNIGAFAGTKEASKAP